MKASGNEMGSPGRIFLCHASEDKAKVVEVYRLLKQQRLNPWLDQEDLLPGQRWDQEIPKAIRASDFLLIFFSQISVLKRGYVQKEFKLALEVLDEIPEGQIFVIPVRLDDCIIPEQFRQLHYCDLFKDDGLDKVVRAIRASLKSGHPGPATILRSQATKSLSLYAAKAMLHEKDLFDSGLHKAGKGLKHQYEVVEQQGANLVIDYATDLTWQRSGSPNWMIYTDAEKYIRKLNTQKFAGFSDWRLPTLEEAMSLMEPERMENDLYIDPVFDETQRRIWTADKKAPGEAWLVYFSTGVCLYNFMSIDYSVRAVRSGQSVI